MPAVPAIILIKMGLVSVSVAFGAVWPILLNTIDGMTVVVQVASARELPDALGLRALHLRDVLVEPGDVQRAVLVAEVGDDLTAGQLGRQ